MSSIVLPVRYLRKHSVERGSEFTESDLTHRESRIKISAEDTAFVLVDVWNTECESASFGEVGRKWVSIFRGGKSLQERVHRITKEKILPALDTARKVGMTIIHAPTMHVAIKYEQYRKQFPDPFPPSPEYDWPPAEFKKERTEKILNLLYGKGAAVADGLRAKTYDDISSLVKPLETEPVVATGEQLNHILKERKIVNLIYVGFASNLCLFIKPGGLMEMWNRGYNVVILRDCTTTVETSHFGSGLCDELAIEWLELYSFFTADSSDFMRAWK